MTALLPCPLCGAQEGYTLIDGGDYKRWSVQCMGCGEVLSECRRTYPDGEEETRSDQGDAAWNDAGAYAQSLRDATALAVAAERERCIWVCVSVCSPGTDRYADGYNQAAIDCEQRIEAGT